MKKKGSHVGVVLSFVIFIVFVFFLYIIIRPNLTTDDRQGSLDYLESKIKEQTSTVFSVVSINLDSPGPPNCALLDSFFSSTGMGNNIIVKDDSGNIVDVGNSNGDLIIDRISTDDSFFKIYESDEFSDIGSDTPCPQNSYSLSNVDSTIKVFETKVIEFIQDYDGDYDSLKEELEFQLNEFSFEFTYGNGTTISPENVNLSIPENVNIYSENIYIQYVNKNTDIETGIFNIKVW